MGIDEIDFVTGALRAGPVMSVELDPDREDQGTELITNAGKLYMRESGKSRNGSENYIWSKVLGSYQMPQYPPLT